MPSVTARRQRAGVTRSLLAVLVFVVLLVVPISAPHSVEAASLQDQIAAQKERQEALTNSINKSQQLVESLRRDEARTRSDLAQTKKDLNDIRADQVAVKARIKKVIARIVRIEARHAELVEEQRQTDFTLGLLQQELAAGEADLNRRRESLSQRLIDAYRTESTTLIEQVFTAESFSDVLTETSAQLSLGDRDAQLAEQIIEDQQALDNLRLLTTSTRLHTDQLRRDTLETQAQVESLKRQLEKAKKRLDVLEARTKRAQERQEAQIRAIFKSKKAAQAAVRRQQSIRSSIINSIRAKTAALQARATRQFGVRGGSGGGQFAWPATGNISQPYGCTGYAFNPPRGGCAHFHDGIDIANRSGTPIRAAASGVVAYAGWNRWELNPAYIVIIAHGGGISTLYAHMQPTGAAQVGRSVKRGTQIGSMGTTGNVTGPHLHFEVWNGDWSPISPYAYL